MRRLLVVLASTPLLLATAGCGGATDVSRTAFEQRLRQRNHLDRQQATCVGRYVFRAYDDASIRTLYRSGLSDLPPVQWNEYATALIACSVHGEVGGT